MARSEDSPDERFPDEVGAREKRRLKARARGKEQVWFGLGLFGVVGWSVAVPTVAGVLAGIWIDVRFHSRYSWTLMLLVIGLAVGCANAWYWIKRQEEAIRKERQDESGHTP